MQERPRLWVIDLDGVVWTGSEPIPGSVEALARITECGDRVVFCTNFAASPDDKRQELRDIGVPEPVVVTSAEAAAHRLTPGARTLALGEPGLVSVLGDAGMIVTHVDDLPPDGPTGPMDAVVVGATPNWDRSRIGLTADAVRAGALFVATNDDPTYPVTTPVGRRLLPGAGALVAAVQTASGREPEVAGKPNLPMAELLLDRFGPVDLVVGDRYDTDGGLAQVLGCDFALVLSGTTDLSQARAGATERTIIGADLAAVVDQIHGTISDDTDPIPR